MVLGGALALAACADVSRQARTVGQATVVIRDVSVVDVVSGTVRPHSIVTVVGDQIAAVSSARDGPVPDGARVIEGGGRFLIPGLWDMHSHSLWSVKAMRTALPLYVSNGVTGIRDMGGQLPVLAAFRDSIREHDPSWPRVIAAGAILDGPAPVQPDVSIAVSDSTSAVDAVRMLSRAKVDFIKVYTMLPRDAYLAAIGEARRLGLPVAGHVPAAVTVEEAALAGQRSIEHLRDEVEPLCRPSAAADCVRLAAIFRACDTWQVPTLVTLRAKAMFDDPSIDDDPRLRYVPRELRDEWSAGRQAKVRRGSEYLLSKRTRYLDEMWLTGFLAQQQVPLLAGTDAGTPYCYPGFSLHDELALLVAAGLTPLAALRAATLSPADFLGTRATMGTIEVGRVADMVLLNDNPLQNIGATREIEAVVLRGRVLERQELDRMLAAAAAGAIN